ncbi:hypothetical protein ACHAPT_009207 [Fusarium lateritium]
MSENEKKQFIRFRVDNTTYPGPRQATPGVQGESDPQPRNTITLRPTRGIIFPPELSYGYRPEDVPPVADAPEEEFTDLEKPLGKRIIQLRGGVSSSKGGASGARGKLISFLKPQVEGSITLRPNNPAPSVSFKIEGSITFRQDNDAPPVLSKANVEDDAASRYPKVDWDTHAQRQCKCGIPLDRTPSTMTHLVQVPPGFTEAQRGQANLYDAPLEDIPSGLSTPGISQPTAGPALGLTTPEQTPRRVHSSTSSFESKKRNLTPIKTKGLNPGANIFTPSTPSPMVSIAKNKTPTAPAAHSRLGQSGPLGPELARDKIFLDSQALLLQKAMLREELPWGDESSSGQVRTNQETVNRISQFNQRVVEAERAQARINQQRMNRVFQLNHRMIEDERDRIDAVNDLFWAQATPGMPEPEAELKK